MGCSWLSGEKSFGSLRQEGLGEATDIFRMRKERLLKTRPEETAWIYTQLYFSMKTEPYLSCHCTD